MTERLDRIEAILAANAEQQAANTQAIAANAERQAQNTEGLIRVRADIEAMLEGISNLAVLAEGNEQSIARLEKLVEANTQTSAANATRFDVLSADAKADRQRATAERLAWQAKSDELDAKDRADRLEWRAGFDEVIAVANADRRQADARHEAQQEIIQTLLLELARTNHRIINLEQQVS